MQEVNQHYNNKKKNTMMPLAAPQLLLKLHDQCGTLSESKVIAFLHENGAATRGRIMNGTGMKRTTVHDTLVRLHVKEMVKREIVKQGRGRPAACKLK